MFLQNVQVELAELIIENEMKTDLVQPAKNLIIYQNNLITHFVNALKYTYPLTEKLLGEEAFKALARDYIDSYPSTSGNLNDYGEYFAYFIAQYQGAANLVYLPEVAAFEWACHLIMQAADNAPLDPACLEPFTEEDKNNLRFQLHPASYLMACQYPLFKIIELCKGKINAIDSIEPEKRYLLLQRRNNEIALTTLSPAAYHFLQALSGNQSLLEAKQAALAIDPDFEGNHVLLDMIKNCSITDVIVY